MGFVSGDIRRSGSHMTVKTNRHRGDAMTMAMTREVSAMTSLARTTTYRHRSRFTVGCSQGAGRHIMAGSTVIMNFINSQTERHRRRGTCGRGMAGITVGGGCHPREMIGIGMAGEIGAMTGITVTATGRHGRGLAIACLQATVAVVASGTGIMHLIVREGYRNTHCRANDS